MNPFTELWKGRCIKIMENIDEISTRGDKENVVELFVTEDGIVFEDNFHILFVEILQASFTSLSNAFAKIQDEVFSLKYVTNEEQRILNSPNLDSNQKERIQTIFAEIKEGVKQIESLGRKIPELYAELHSINESSITNNKPSSEHVEEKKPDVEEAEEKKINILSRLIGCFVFSLYAYMDIYCMAIFQSIISCCSPENLFDVYSKLKSATNPMRNQKQWSSVISVVSNLRNVLLDPRPT